MGTDDVQEAIIVVAVSRIMAVLFMVEVCEIDCKVTQKNGIVAHEEKFCAKRAKNVKNEAWREVFAAFPIHSGIKNEG